MVKKRSRRTQKPAARTRNARCAGRKRDQARKAVKKYIPVAVMNRYHASFGAKCKAVVQGSEVQVLASGFVTFVCEVQKWSKTISLSQLK